MPTHRFPVGQVIDAAFPTYTMRMSFLPEGRLGLEIASGPFARSELVDTEMVSLGGGKFVLSWQEQSGATVVSVHDYDRGVVQSYVTSPGGEFDRMTGDIIVIEAGGRQGDDYLERNKALVLEALTAVLQHRDVSAVDRFCAENFIQHEPNFPRGRDGLKLLLATMPPVLDYEPGLVIAEGSLVAVHGRLRGWVERPLIVVNIYRIEDGKLAEGWSVATDEQPILEDSRGHAMFDPRERWLVSAE